MIYYPLVLHVLSRDNLCRWSGLQTHPGSLPSLLFHSSWVSNDTSLLSPLLLHTYTDSRSVIMSLLSPQITTPSLSHVHLIYMRMILYAIAPTADLAATRLQSHFVAVQEALIDLKLVLDTDKTKYMLFSSSHKIVTDGLHLHSLDVSFNRRRPCIQLFWYLDWQWFIVKKHTTKLVKKDLKWALFDRNRSCLSLVSSKPFVQSTLIMVILFIKMQMPLLNIWMTFLIAPLIWSNKTI